MFNMTRIVAKNLSFTSQLVKCKEILRKIDKELDEIGNTPLNDSTVQPRKQLLEMIDDFLEKRRIRIIY